MVDQAPWNKLLTTAPLWETSDREVFGGQLVQKAYEKLHYWYCARLQREPALLEELSDVVAEFVDDLAKKDFACLEQVSVEHREAYLWQTLRNRSKRHFKRKAAYAGHFPPVAMRETDAEGEEVESLMEAVASPDKGPEETALQKAFADEVMKVVAKMPQARQDVFHDRYVEQMTERETAEHLQMALNTVKWHDRQARIALVRHFGVDGA